MIIRTDNLPWPIAPRLRHLLQHEISSSSIDKNYGVVIHFRDPEYDHATGGYHPVEIAVDRGGAIQYVTDFALYGAPPQVELCKEIDFDFGLKLFQHFARDYPINQGRGLYKIWEENFISYYDRQVYQVEVSALG